MILFHIDFLFPVVLKFAEPILYSKFAHKSGYKVVSAMNPICKREAGDVFAQLFHGHILSSSWNRTRNFCVGFVENPLYSFLVSVWGPHGESTFTRYAGTGAKAPIKLVPNAGWGK